jgi:hypothetical protein|uniref:Uncharacterized protein n=1 Tax=Globisporangium ultimum (strain ATCC 200006 / CBS 805.95 / DAOM BR144) TaxID=431595 RepID=K3WX74_GLOUD
MKSVARLRQILGAVCWDDVKAALERGQPYHVCSTTAKAWSKHYGSENQMVMRNVVKFDNGEIYIFELPHSLQHSTTMTILRRAIETESGGIMRNCVLTLEGASDILVDLSFGLEPRLKLPFQLPRGIPTPLDLRTLQVEIGHYQDWGTRVTHLDWKASLWWTFPGVEYTLRQD